MEEYGPEAAVDLLWAYEAATGRSCHDAAHEVGRRAYELFGAAAFAFGAHECQVGAMHGAMEALLAERGTSRIKEDLTTICDRVANIWQNGNCWHGVGHGLLAWTSYELPDALALCDLFDRAGATHSCYGGMFMENVVGGASALTGHESEWINDFDPHFPCNALEEKYVAPCYGYQPVQMARINPEPEFVRDGCLTAPTVALHACFFTMGLYAHSKDGRGDPAEAIEICEMIDEHLHRNSCMRGVVSDRFWQADEAPGAAYICEQMKTRSSASECWYAMFERAGIMYPDDIGIRSELCELVTEDTYRRYCYERLVNRR